MALSEPRPTPSQGVFEELVGIDLTSDPRWQDVWHPDSGTTRSLSGLPAGSSVSPWGYLFFPRNSLDLDGPALRVTVHDSSLWDVGASQRAERGFRQTVTIGVPGQREKLSVVLEDADVHVCASPAAWDALSEAVLLIVAQYCRYRTTENLFCDLHAKSRREYRHAVGAGLPSLTLRRQVTMAAIDSRCHVSDWVYYTGPATDPRRTCSSESSYEAYVEMAEILDFPQWAKTIDVVVEDVEQTYEAAADKLFHYRLFAWGVLLEIVIIILLVGLIFR